MNKIATIKDKYFEADGSPKSTEVDKDDVKHLVDSAEEFERALLAISTTGSDVGVAVKTAMDKYKEAAE